MGIRADIYRKNRAQENETIPFSINNGSTADNADSMLLWVDQIHSSGITIYLSGLKSESGDVSNVANPLRLDWYLYQSGACIPEDEPVWEGSTWIDVTKGTDTRSGMLVQCTGVASQAWFLRVVMAAPGETVSLKGALEYTCPDQPIVGGPLLATGSAVG
jgi:hypothetical protein